LTRLRSSRCGRRWSTCWRGSARCGPCCAPGGRGKHQERAERRRGEQGRAAAARLSSGVESGAGGAH
jgi:hypothetical protein